MTCEENKTSAETKTCILEGMSERDLYQCDLAARLSVEISKKRMYGNKTFEDLAVILGVPRDMVSDLEFGEVIPKINEIKKHLAKLEQL